MTLSESKDYFMAGALKPSDWRTRKDQLLKNGTTNDWFMTFNDFFVARLESRYLGPIKMLQNEGTFQGEGFSIVTIQCALIEFLAATKLGKNYRFVRNGEKLKSDEYNNSREIFTNFLITEEPFNQWVKNKDEAVNFYSNVRCALLHEARTKNGWLIWASGDVAINPNDKIVRRDALQIAIKQFIDSYGKILMTDKKLQDAFVRKFDHLADG